MNAITKRAVPGLVLAVCLMGGFSNVSGLEKFVTIGTGGVSGVYYPAGGAICRLVNQQRKSHGIRCAAESTGGSVDNLKRIRNDDLTFGVVQSDWQFHSYHGSSKFTDIGADRRLRAVFSLHAEPFTVVARADSTIKRFDDLNGKRVNIGNPGSGQRATMEVVMGAHGWRRSNFRLVREFPSAVQSEALCANEIDAMVFVAGHPSGTIKQATTACDAVIIEVSGPSVDKLVTGHDYYRYAMIPGGMYRGAPEDIKTFGVGATLVSSTAVPDNVVYEIVKSVFENFDVFKSMHPALSFLKQEEMVKDGLSAPLHPGAVRYYKEVGLQ